MSVLQNKKTASKEDCPCKSGMLKMKSEMVSLIHYLSYAVRKCRQLQLARNVTRVQVAKKCCYTACEFILQRTKTHDIAYKTKTAHPVKGGRQVGHDLIYKDVPLNGFKRSGLYLVRTYSAISASGIVFRISSQHSALIPIRPPMPSAFHRA